MTTIEALSPAPQEALSPRELLLERAGTILQRGALANALIAVASIVLGLVAGLRIVPNLFSILQGVLLARYVGGADAALAVVVLLALLDVSLLLVMMVGVLAREVWALPALVLLIIGNLIALLLLGFTPAVVTIVFALWAILALRADTQAFRVNPVMLKELRGRMRGVRAFAVMTVYLGLMSGFTTLLYLVYSSFSRTSGSAAAGEIGRVLFLGVVGIELLLIIFIAPAFTAGAITGERERQTYDLLQTTLLATPSFVIGKLESALGYILLLLLSGIPLQSIAFLFGGVTELELVLSFVILMVTAIALGTVGIYFSAAMPRTLVASVRAYSVILGTMFVAPVLFSAVLNIVNDVLFTRAGSGISPVMETIVRYLDLLLTSVNPIAAGLSTQNLLVDQRILGFWSFTLRSDGSKIPLVSPWISFTIVYLTVSAVLIVLTIRSTRKNANS
jgi:ABC-2 type transport system permease protein